MDRYDTKGRFYIQRKQLLSDFWKPHPVIIVPQISFAIKS